MRKSIVPLRHDAAREEKIPLDEATPRRRTTKKTGSRNANNAEISVEVMPGDVRGTYEGAMKQLQCERVMIVKSDRQLGQGKGSWQHLGRTVLLGK